VHGQREDGGGDGAVVEQGIGRPCRGGEHGGETNSGTAAIAKAARAAKATPGRATVRAEASVPSATP
jgi:hypothetical protein